MTVPMERVENRILIICGHPVMLDADSTGSQTVTLKTVRGQRPEIQGQPLITLDDSIGMRYYSFR
jgi:hypothetical protein